MARGGLLLEEFEEKCGKTVRKLWEIAGIVGNCGKIDIRNVDGNLEKSHVLGDSLFNFFVLHFLSFVLSYLQKKEN